MKREAAALAGKPAAAPQSGRKLGAPLEGITVLDLGLAIAGPYGTQMLSDLGRHGHQGQRALRHLLALATTSPIMANRGKRSIALDLKDARAMKVLRELVERADVVQHNMRYDAAERLGIDYESLSRSIRS